MNLYFISDIFLSKPAGIHRYAMEMIHLLLKDGDHCVRFVTVGEAPIDELDRKLAQLFGSSKKIYDRRVIAGIEFNGKLLMRFTLLHERYKMRIKEEGKTWLKPVREFFKMLRRIEEFLLSLTHFKYEGDHPVLFSPYHDAGTLLKSKNKPFMVHVVHDVIPVIAPKYFESTKVFDRIFSSLSKADLIITVSESTKHDLISHHRDIDPESVHAVPIAASESFQPVNDPDLLTTTKRKYGIPPESDYILSLCTMEPRKNHLRLLEAWAKVVGDLKLKQPKLVIAGDAGWGVGLQGDIHDALEKTDSIIATGYVDDADLPILYSGCTFSIYPSLYEGFGLPVLESMRCGRFCLTSNISSMPEITGDGLPLVDPHDVDSIADGILKVANDDEFRQELECISIERSKIFSWKASHEKTVSLIREKLKSS